MGHEKLLAEVGLTPEGIFADARVKAWRRLPDRENCTFDADRQDGRHVRWHIKRYPRSAAGKSPARVEAAGAGLLIEGQIPTAPVVAWNELADGRSYIIFEDLAGYQAADKLIEQGQPFERLLEGTAELAAKLHAAGLHHRDLYLCHFFVRIEPTATDVRLIDAARVRRLPRWPFRNRWIVKDLAQFWYSATRLGVTKELRTRWLERYAEITQVRSIASLRRSIQRKASWIERHDRKLNVRQPNRNISIPQTTPLEHR